MTFRRARRALAVVVGLLFVVPAAAPAADPDPVQQWLPSSDGATWTYQWSDSVHAPAPTRERYDLERREGAGFTVRWTTRDLENGEGTVESEGAMQFQRGQSGLLATSWSSTPPPSDFPVLCADASGCGNSLAGTYYLMVWGTRSPVLAEPLLTGTRWRSLGGANNDVSSENRYLGTESVVVPAFPAGVRAAKVESDVTQAGALGDPYGSGIRTVWWVYGVGPVKIEFRHTGGELQRSELLKTNLTPLAPPPDANHMPLGQGDRFTLRWRNSKHMRAWSTQRFEVAQVVNNTARVEVASRSGPIRVAGSYVFANRLTGVTNISAFVRAQSRVKFPPLGPRSEPEDRRRRFFTPLDLMAFGFNPVLTAYPAAGQTWRSATGSRDFRVFGVTGTSRVIGTRRVTTPAGRFDALAVVSDLKQKGFRFGSGRRVSYFAPGKGLVKLVFRHRDGSVSTVDRVR